MAGKRWLYLVGALVGLAGMIVAFLPSRTLDEVCPWLAARGQEGASTEQRHEEPATRNAALYPLARLLFLAEGVMARRTPTGWRAFTRDQLPAYDGTNPWRPILLGMNGDVFDVTEKGCVSRSGRWVVVGRSGGGGGKRTERMHQQRKQQPAPTTAGTITTVPAPDTTCSQVSCSCG